MEDVVMAMAANALAADLDYVLAETGALWEDLRGARLFITGGTGFFGCWLLETFAWANARLRLGASAVVLTRRPDAFRTKAPHLAADRAIALHQGDVRTSTFPDGTFSHVIHAATDSGAPLQDRDRLLMFDTIVDGTRRTLECARRAGASRFLLTSSGAVYGRQPSDLSHVPEDYAGAPDPTDPAQVYGEAKRAAEMLCALHADESFTPVIARCFAFVGPYLPLDAHFAVGNFIRDALAGGPIRVNGDGTPYRSYLYAADLAIWLWTILLRGKSMRPYNVGSEEAVTIGELAQAVGRALGIVDIHMAERSVPGKRPTRYVPDVTRAHRELLLRKGVALEDGVSRTAGWHRAQRMLSAQQVR